MTKNYFRQALKDLGLGDYDIRLISSLKSLVGKDIEYIKQQLSIEDYDLPSLEYSAMYNRITNRKLKGNEAKQYVREFTSSIRRDVQSVLKTGHTQTIVDKYQAITDYYVMDINTWLNLERNKRVELLKSAIYDLTGEYGYNSDEAILITHLNGILKHIKGF